MKISNTPISAEMARQQLQKTNITLRSMGAPVTGRVMVREHEKLGPMSIAEERANLKEVNNPHGKSLKGKRADLGNVFFRSRSEANYARFLNHCIEKGIAGIARWEYEPQEFEFPIKRGNRFYKPDFKVIMVDGTYEWHEVKGWMNAQSKTKLKRFKQFFPQEEARLQIIGMPEIAQIKTIFGGIIREWE